MFDRCALLFFSTKILSEDPYLKSFIRRVLCSYRERFCSSRASVIRLHAAPYFLPALHSAACTKAVNPERSLTGLRSKQFLGPTRKGVFREKIISPPNFEATGLGLEQTVVAVMPYCNIAVLT